MAQHVPEGQVGVFLAALHQLMCTQQQGITSMVVTQARVPVHLGVHSWAMQASMTWLFAQVIPGLGSFSGSAPASIAGSTAAVMEEVQYMPIPPGESMMVPVRLFPRKQVRSDGTATRPIYLGNDTDSGISSISHSTLMKALGGKHQPLASTPKTKPKLLVTAQQQRNELAAMRQGAPHGVHVQPFQNQTSQTQPWGSDLFGWKSAVNPGTSGNSSVVSVEEHTHYTTATVMQRDAPSCIDSDDDDVVSIHNDPHSDVEMVSTHEQPEQHTEDSSPDSGAEDSHNPSDDSEMESDQDRHSGHHSDSSSGHDSNPSLNLGSVAGSASSSEADSSSSDDGGDFMDMFQQKRKDPDTPKKPESRPQSSNRSRSRESENQK